MNTTTTTTRKNEQAKARPQTAQPVDRDHYRRWGGWRPRTHTPIDA